MTYKLFLKDLFLDTIWEVLYFPIWWYSRGLKKTVLFCWRRVSGGWSALALSIFLKNFFKPMYGQRGWDAYVLSLATHFLQLVWRLFFNGCLGFGVGSCFGTLAVFASFSCLAVGLGSKQSRSDLKMPNLAI